MLDIFGFECISGILLFLSSLPGYLPVREAQQRHHLPPSHESSSSYDLGSTSSSKLSNVHRSKSLQAINNASSSSSSSSKQRTTFYVAHTPPRSPVSPRKPNNVPTTPTLDEEEQGNKSRVYFGFIFNYSSQPVFHHRFQASCCSMRR